MKKASSVSDEPYISKIRRRTKLQSDQSILGKFESYTLDSAFQPIFSLAHKRAVGYEALIRARNQFGNILPPAELFKQDMDEDQHIFLDRLCRYVHIANFERIPDNLNWLFLNISPKVVACGAQKGAFFKDLLDEFSFPASRVVVEVVENPIDDQTSLLETTNFYRDLGCLIAIDDFGAGHSNFERIWMLQPHIVKLDRSMILQAEKEKRIRQLLPGIISLLHQAGALVLIEGIETMDHALMAMESDADFVQGYYFAKPSRDIDALQAGFQGFDDLFTRFKDTTIQQQEEIDSLYERYRNPFAQAIWGLREGKQLQEACLPLISDPSVVRCYLLNPNGIQIGSTIVSANSELQADHRFDPLSDANSADWFRRHYLRRAIVHPKQLQITRPYLSITGSHMCVTLSMMYPTNQGKIVLCCDLNRSI